MRALTDEARTVRTARDARRLRRAAERFGGWLGGVDVRVLGDADFARALAEIRDGRFQRVSLKHGGHDFLPEEGAPLGRFRDDKMGTGEGAQAFGWGHYLTSNNAIARWYADKVYAQVSSSFKKETAFVKSLARSKLMKAQSMHMRDDGKPWEGELGAVLRSPLDIVRGMMWDLSRFPSLDRAVRHTLETEAERAEQNEQNKLWYAQRRHDKNKGDKIALAALRTAKDRFKAAQEAKKRLLALTTEEFFTPEFLAAAEEEFRYQKTHDVPQHHVYTAEVETGEDDANLLDWVKPMTAEQKERLFAQAEKELNGAEMEGFEDAFSVGRLSASQFHESPMIEYIFGTPKEISKFLHRAGFVGHKFPAMSMGAGNYSKGTNYVIYDGNDITIVDHLRYFRDGSGEVFGWFDAETREVVVSEGARADTLLHELGWHATYAWAERNAPELRERMRRFAESAPVELKELVAEAYGYEDGEISPEAFLDEVGAAFFSEENADLVEKAIDGIEDSSVRGVVRRWWNAFRELVFKAWARLTGTYERYWTADGKRKADLSSVLDASKSAAAAMRALAGEFAKARILAERANARENAEGADSDGVLRDAAAAWARRNAGESGLARDLDADIREARGAFSGSVYDEDAEVSVVEIETPLDVDAQKRTSEIRNEILKPLIGQVVEIASDGRLVRISREGVESALKKRNIHRAVLKDLERIISGSRYFDYVEGDGQEKHKNVLGQFVYAVPVRIGGTIYRCEIKIDRLTSSEVGEGAFKQQSVFKITDVALSAGLAGQGRSEAGASSTTSAMMRMGELMEGRKPKTPSVRFRKEVGDAGDIGDSGAERERIEREAKANGTWLKAPNGADTKLTPEQWTTVRTRAFKAWFGDWEHDPKNASKVVDENGEPLVVYHGTSADAEFYEFSHKFTMRNGASLGRGFYFTEDEDYARGYGNKVIGVFLDIRNPLEPGRNKISKEDLKRVIRHLDPNGETVADYASSSKGYPGKEWYERSLDEAVDAIFSERNNYVETSDSDILGELFSVWGGERALRGVAAVLGYDGFIPKRTFSDDVRIAFLPEQIKSATENLGTFDAGNPDIRYSRGLPRTRGRVRAAAEAYRRLVSELDAAERAGEISSWGDFANKFLAAAQMRNLFSALTEAELSSGLGDTELLALQSERAARKRDLRAAEEAAKLAAERALGKASNRALSRSVKLSMEHFGLPDFGGEGGLTVGWARTVAEKLREAYGSGKGAEALVLETAKRVLVPHYMRAATRLLSAANAVKAAEAADRLEAAKSMESV